MLRSVVLTSRRCFSPRLLVQLSFFLLTFQFGAETIAIDRDVYRWFPPHLRRVLRRTFLVCLNLLNPSNEAPGTPARPNRPSFPCNICSAPAFRSQRFLCFLICYLVRFWLVHWRAPSLTGSVRLIVVSELLADLASATPTALST